MNAPRLECYAWVGSKNPTTLQVVFTSKNKRNELLERLEESVGLRLERSWGIDLTDLDKESQVKYKALLDGWVRNVNRSGAILALGLSAL